MKFNIRLITTYLSFLIFCVSAYSQDSKIIDLPEERAYKYISYHSNGQIEKEVGFYAKKPYNSIAEFEKKLKAYKIKNHGPEKKYYSNGQLQEIVVYEKGKVTEFARQYFDDGEEYFVVLDERPTFQFRIAEYNSWFFKRIREVEKKYNINLEGVGFIALEIRKDGTINSVKIPSKYKDNEKYLIEIGEQVQVLKPAIKDGQPVGTKFGFRIDL